jgi:hypothetical protein
MLRFWWSMEVAACGDTCSAGPVFSRTPESREPAVLVLRTGTHAIACRLVNGHGDETGVQGGRVRLRYRSVPTENLMGCEFGLQLLADRFVPAARGEQPLRSFSDAVGNRGIFKAGVSEQERFLNEYPLFSSGDAVYLTDSRRGGGSSPEERCKPASSVGWLASLG